MRVPVSRTGQYRTRGLGLDTRVHEGKDCVIAIALQGLHLAAGKQLAVTQVLTQGNPGKHSRMAEYLGYDRHAIRFLETQGRLDSFYAVHFSPPAMRSR
jgi:hypothetical protein